MTKSQLVSQCKALIKEAYVEATEMIVAYLELHPDEARQPLCKEIDPENWDALQKRVIRLQEKRRSEGGSKPPIGRPATWQEGDARRFFNNATVPGERKAQIVAEALSDDYVARQVTARITGDPDLLRLIDRTRRSMDRGVLVGREPRTLADDWQQWLARLNSVLIEGARLAERTERTEAEDVRSLVPRVALFAYEMITEKKIDAELRQLLAAEGVR